MTIAISPALRTARADAVRALIDGAAGSPGVLKLYGGAQPAAGAAAPSAPLVVIPLAHPCGVAAASGLTLAQPADAQASASGVVTWGRIEDSVGQWVIDADAAADDGSGGPAGVAIILDQTQVYPGARVSILSIVFSEA